jgi:class 3 adenylate cyclase/tetratricopeptide (TPR) repeat protein
LTEKILTSRAALEGERKQVTVMFADIKGSTAMIEGLDPEEARRRIGPVLQLMMDAVHRYEGTVNQSLGDGIMAIFGAPVAHEDHALRACYAALAMQTAMRRYSDEVNRTQDLTVQVRIGLNSGEVVVGTIGTDLFMNYSAVGQTTHLAARMEQLAMPGSICLTADTLSLVKGWVQSNAVGPVSVKGVTEPVEVYELIGTARTRPRFRTAVTQRLSNFVGRQHELQVLDEALTRAISGQGQVVAIGGEPGLGKSRLVYEFSQRPLAEGCRLLEASGVSYGQTTPYLPIRDLFRTYFHIEESDDALTIREKVDKCLAWEMDLQQLWPVVMALLDETVDNPEWQALDPPQRRQRIIESVKRLLLQQSQAQPLLVCIENLHWIDAGTQAVLDSLVESLSSSRLLLVLTYRPEYQPRWAHQPSYTPLALAPLVDASADALFAELLGTSTELLPLKQLLLERTEGNPFFIEECIHTLVETRVLSGERGAYSVEKPLANIGVPATVQAILAARIDRLSTVEKQLLQSAAVIGKEMPLSILQAIAELPEAALRRSLDHLQQADFLYETSLYPEPVYTFKHALTHDVAYESLLQEQRRLLHDQIVTAIERLWSDRLTAQIEPLAHHAWHGQNWEKVFIYGRQAGLKAATRSAHREAIAYFEQALIALPHLTETHEMTEQAIDLRFDLRNALWPLSEHERAFEHLCIAETLARALNDQRRLGRAFAYLTEYFRITGKLDRAVSSGEGSLALALSLKDGDLQVMAASFLGAACLALSDYRRAVDYFNSIVSALQGERLYERCGMTGFPAVMSRTWLVSCLTDLGEFELGQMRGQEAIRLAESADHPFSLTQAYYTLGTLFLHQGDLKQAVPILERGLSLCQTASILTWFPSVAAALGYALTLSERIAEALPLLQQAVARDTSKGVAVGHARRLAYLSESYLLTDRREEAAELARQALALARSLQSRGHEAAALWLLGEIHMHQETPADDTPETYYRQALALAHELGMRPLQARCHLALGLWLLNRGQQVLAGAELSTAVTLFREMQMMLWLPRTEAALVQARAG